MVRDEVWAATGLPVSITPCAPAGDLSVCRLPRTPSRLHPDPRRFHFRPDQQFQPPRHAAAAPAQAGLCPPPGPARPSASGVGAVKDGNQVRGGPSGAGDIRHRQRRRGASRPLPSLPTCGMLTTLAPAVLAGSAGDARGRPRWALVGIRRAALSRSGGRRWASRNRRQRSDQASSRSCLRWFISCSRRADVDAAEMVLRACMRSRWPHLGRDHLLHVLQIALAQSPLAPRNSHAPGGLGDRPGFAWGQNREVSCRIRRRGGCSRFHDR